MDFKLVTKLGDLLARNSLTNLNFDANFIEQVIR